MAVPLLDLRAQHATIRDEVVGAMMGVVDDQAFILGRAGRAARAQVAELSHTKYAIGCANGTDAILLALRALDIGRGDEVITTPFTFFATAGTIHNVGATPVFVDIDPDTFNIVAGSDRRGDHASSTKAVIPVDLFGQMAPIEAGHAALRRAFRSSRTRRSRSARAARSTASGAMAGEAATIGTFSFFPSKNLGGYGDGGMIVTQDEAIADAAASGSACTAARRRTTTTKSGTTAGSTRCRRRCFSAKLPHLAGWSAKRATNAAYYDAAFADIDGCAHAVRSIRPTSRSTTSTRSAWTARDELQAHPQGARNRHVDLLSASAPSAAVLRLSRLQARAACPESEKAAKRSALACRSTLSSPRRSSTKSSEAVRAFYGR